MGASKMALEHAGLKEGVFDPKRSGIVYASGVGGILSMEVGPAATPGENACDLCVGILFADRQAHTACFENPIFLKLRSEMLSLCKRITIADYPLDWGTPSLQQ